MSKPGNCTLTSMTQLEVMTDPNVINGVQDNPAFQFESCDSGVDIPTKELPAEENLLKYRGLSKNEVILRSQAPLWTQMRHTFYMLTFILWAALMVTMIVIALVHPKCRAQPATSWWQGAVYYRVYVPMFKDSNGDCKGDFQGIVSKLDYLKEIGVDAVSLSPIYPEDNKDVEFSITNHTSVDSQYGDIQDLIDLISAVHKRGMYLVLDFIPNMTGKEHEWFKESQMSSGRNRQNFYVWVDGPNTPNNWKTQTDNAAWSLSSKRNATFLHQVDAALPDLNLRSSIVLDELNNILRYWMSLGVDGFNLRHLGLLLEDYDLRDEPEAQPSITFDKGSYAHLDHKYTLNLPDNFHLLRSWRNLVSGFDNKTRILMTGMDSNGKNVALYEDVYGSIDDDFLTPYVIFLDPRNQCGGSCIKNYIKGKLGKFPTKDFPIWMLGSDVTSRLHTRLNNNVERQEALTMLTFLLPGSVLLYYGDEIYMADVPLKGNWNSASLNKPWRSPMVWGNSSVAGFSNNSSCSSFPSGQNKTTGFSLAHTQLSNSTSMLNFIKDLTRLRKDPGFHIGDFQYGLSDEAVFSFIRGFDGTDCFLVAVNLSKKKIRRNFASGPGMVSSDAKVRLLTPSSKNEDTPLGEDIDTGSISLDGYQGIVVSWSCGLRQ